MNKEEFLNKLRKKLSVLEDSEIEDIISEYRGYIEEKVNVGLTEEEATKELGDIDEIARDLLAAYKVKSEPEEGTFNRLINKLSAGLDNFFESLNDKSAKDIIKVLIEIVIILFLICLLKIPFAIIRDLGSNIFEELVNPVGNIFSGLWRFIIELSYVIVAILFFFKMFEQRYFRDVSEKIVEEHETYVKEEPKPKKTKTTSATEKSKPAKVIVKEKDNSFVDVLSTICIYILKFLVIFFLIGVIFYLIGMSIAIGFAIYFLIKGVTYYGILILLVALFLGGAFILELGLNFIFNKKIKSYHVFGKLIICIIILALGLTLSAIEIGSTEIIYDNNYKETKTITKKIEMTDDLKLYNYDTLIVDNSLGNTIKIEYVYPDFKNDINLSIELESCGKNGYCLYTNVKRFKWSIHFLDSVIEDLKNKKIYTYDYRVEKIIYASEENINKLKNKHHYYDEEVSVPLTKTFDVLNISSSNNEIYSYLTIKEHDEDEVVTVKVLKAFATQVEASQSYEFTFEYTGSTPDDDIEEIFAECKLINIVHHNITDLNQSHNTLIN